MDVLDASTHFNTYSDGDTAIVRYSARHFSTTWADGVWVRLALTQLILSTLDGIRSSRMDGPCMSCGGIATGRVSAGDARHAGEGGGKFWRFWCRAVHRRRNRHCKSQLTRMSLQPTQGIGSSSEPVWEQGMTLPKPPRGGALHLRLMLRCHSCRSCDETNFNSLSFLF